MHKNRWKKPLAKKLSGSVPSQRVYRIYPKRRTTIKLTRVRTRSWSPVTCTAAEPRHESTESEKSTVQPSGLRILISKYYAPQTCLRPVAFAGFDVGAHGGIHRGAPTVAAGGTQLISITNEAGESTHWPLRPHSPTKSAHVQFDKKAPEPRI